MERFIGEKRALLMNRGTLHVRSIEASLKLVVQDLKGRRRTALDPRELLCKPTAARASGGGAPVLFPATQFLCTAQRTYATWFGEKASQVRDVRPASFSSQALARAKAAKPRLEKPRQKSKCSEAAFIESHSEACKAAVAALETITSEAEGVLGNKVTNPNAKAATKKRLMSEAADETWQLQKDKRERQSAPEAGCAPAAAAKAAVAKASAAKAAAAPSSRFYICSWQWHWL